MSHRSRRRSTCCSPAPLTASLEELAGSLPPINVAPTAPLSSTLRRRRRPSPSAIITKIAHDAASGCGGGTSIVSVQPVNGTDPLLLFLRRDGETQLMIGVPPDVVRSRRLRQPRERNRHCEREWEMMRVAEAFTSFAPFCDGDDDTL